MSFFPFPFVSFLHSTFLQDDATEANRSSGHGVSCEWQSKVTVKAADLRVAYHVRVFAVSLGQRIFQFAQVDFGERPHGLGFEVHH